MRKKQEKIKQKRLNEPVISINNSIPHLESLTALHAILYGGYTKVNFPKYYLTIMEVNEISNSLIDECLQIEDESSFKDSEINIRMRELCTRLALKYESEIKLIIEYLFDLKNISPDSTLRKQIDTIVEVLHYGKVDELSDTADLSIPFKADLLNYINQINFPYKSESAKRIFFIKLLSHVYLEICEGTLSLFNIHNSIDDPRKAFLEPTKPHPSFNYSSYNNYIDHRYDVINQFLKNKQK